MPLIVLTAGRQPAPGSTLFDAQTIPAAASGHLVHLDAPQAVVEAVRDVLALTR